MYVESKQAISKSLSYNPGIRSSRLASSKLRYSSNHDDSLSAYGIISPMKSASRLDMSTEYQLLSGSRVYLNYNLVKNCLSLAEITILSFQNKKGLFILVIKQLMWLAIWAKTRETSDFWIRKLKDIIEEHHWAMEAKRILLKLHWTILELEDTNCQQFGIVTEHDQLI